MERNRHSAPSLTAGSFLASLFLASVLSFVLTPAAFAAEEEEQEPPKYELYQWKDDRGVVHITDDAGKIPEEYQSRAEKIESVKGDEPAPPPPPAVQRGPAPYQEQPEDTRRKLWQGRLKEWRNKLANAEKRLSELKQKHEEAMGSFGGPTTGRGIFLFEAERIEQEMKKVQAEIDEARHQIEIVIPEEARKAGIPPGWLRE